MYVLSFLPVPYCMKMNNFKNGYNAVYMIMEIKILLHMCAIRN